MIDTGPRNIVVRVGRLGINTIPIHTVTVLAGALQVALCSFGHLLSIGLLPHAPLIIVAALYLMASRTGAPQKIIRKRITIHHAPLYHSAPGKEAVENHRVSPLTERKLHNLVN